MEGTPEQPAIPAGWYPNPNGEGLRYWDGGTWTEHTAPAAGEAATATTTASAAADTAAAGTAAGGTAAGSTAATGDPHAAHAAAAGGGSEGPGTLEWTLSVLLPIVPLAGLIWGLYLRRQGPAMENPSNVAIVLSLAVILVAVLLVR